MQKLFPIIIACLSLSFGAGAVLAQEKGAKSPPKAKQASGEKRSSGKGNKTVTSAKVTSPKKTATKRGKATGPNKNRSKTSAAKGKKTSNGGKATKGKSSVDPSIAAAVKNATEDLNSKDPDVVIEAVQILGATGDTSAVSDLISLLATGPRSDITDSILFALGSLPDEDAEPVVISYLNHRRPDARTAAIMALENYESKTVTEALEKALADSDRQVRAAAAMALGKRGSQGSVPILFIAFERGVVEAAIAIGQLGNEEDSKRLTRYLGREDIKVLLSGFDEFLKREDFPEEAKLNILNRLFDLAGPEVWRFAVTYKATFPPDTDANENRLYKLVNRMVRQIKDK